jgi:hypothetical protein
MAGSEAESPVQLVVGAAVVVVSATAVVGAAAVVDRGLHVPDPQSQVLAQLV